MFDFQDLPLKLDVQLNDSLQQINPTLSKGRVRIFYKGLNRNSTYISEDFAQQLIDSLPYTPIKGIFDNEAEDYKDHGDDNTDGKIYGIVAAKPNFAWEEHLDCDGQLRSYACADVLYFTGLYPEAKLIAGKPQSMEIYKNSLEGEWRINDQTKTPYYYFKKGCLLGLQALGSSVEPCFEGSAFFNRSNQIDEFINYISKINTQEAEHMENNVNVSVEEQTIAEQTSENIEANEFVEVSNDIKETSCAAEASDSTMNEANQVTDSTHDETEKANETVTSNETITDESNASVDGMAAQSNIEVKNEENTNSELETQKSSNENDEFSSLKNEYEAAKLSWENEKAEYEKRINALETSNAEFTEKINQLETEKTVLNNSISDIKGENEKLIAYKNSQEENEKKTILSRYEQYLSEDTIRELSDSMSKYTVVDFKKEVCTAAVESDNSIFSNKDAKPMTFFKGNLSNEKHEMSGIESILESYKNGGNK